MTSKYAKVSTMRKFLPFSVENSLLNYYGTFATKENNRKITVAFRWCHYFKAMRIQGDPGDTACSATSATAESVYELGLNDSSHKIFN